LPPAIFDRLSVPDSPKRSPSRWIAALLVLICCAIRPAQSQTPQEDTLLSWMNSIAQQDLQRRMRVVHSIHTLPEAEERKRMVREEMLNDLGGLPDFRGPLNASITGELHTDSYTIEKVIYQSLPGFFVTANLYRPNQPGRYPAVLLQAGHTQEGKVENQRMAANLALKGFVALSFDPIGQGEREQTYSHQLDQPLAGWSVPEHIELGAQSRLIGRSLARYFIWDAMRSLDYLASRPDVDVTRIGAAGCSGGGALTTFLGALDPRVKAVVPACYPSSFETLFPTTGPHAEMAFPHFLASGLDTADFVELSAPTPWLLESTEVDQYGFSPQGVQLVYREALEWYSLYHARENMSFMVAPGTHGMPLKSREALYQWMIRWLKNGDGDFHEQPVTMFSSFELRVTPTGHVEDLPGSRKLYQLLLEDLQKRQTPQSTADLFSELKRLHIPTDRSAPHVRALRTIGGAAGTEQHLEIESEPGVWLDATLYRPRSSGRKPAVVIVNDREKLNGVSPLELAAKMAARDQVVLVLEPRTSKLKNVEGPFTGDWISDLQADLIGRNLPAMRARDILRGVDFLCSRSDVDPGSIRGVARGVAGVWLLLAAASDSRLDSIWLDRTPASLRSALDNSMTIDLSDAVIPEFMLHWDLQDLVKALAPRPVLWTDPTNWRQRVVALGSPYRYRYVVGDITDDGDAQDDTYIRDFLK
jgi:dienelactone hydrolase